jgi:hypothetical protein
MDQNAAVPIEVLGVIQFVTRREASGSVRGAPDAAPQWRGPPHDDWAFSAFRCTLSRFRDSDGGRGPYFANRWYRRP